MATYQFSALAGGQTISFNPGVDILNFDQTAIAAADVRIAAAGANLRISVDGKDVLLTNVSSLQLATTNVTFADGSRLLFGDNTSGTANDNAANSLTGTAGRDHLAGFGGADTLDGGAGDDVYFVGTGDVISDSGGVDTVFSDVSWSLGTGLENLTFTGTANTSGQGNGLNNWMMGNSGNNYFNGRGGDDLFHGEGGNDTIDMSTGGTGLQGNDRVMGGEGIDTVDYDGYAFSGIVLDLASNFATGGGQGGEGFAEILGVERVVGGGFADSMAGSDGAEYLDGRGGSDRIDGRGGIDTLIGGANADTIVFSAAPGATNADLVTGFVGGTDKIEIDGREYAGIGGSGAFAVGEGRFWSSASGAAHDASDRIVYNSGNGQLWFDADGTGGAAARLIATLQGAPALTATDLAVFNGESHIIGTSGNDTLRGTVGNDILEGLGGNDALSGADGHDRVIGGDGNDTLWGADADNGILYDWEVTDTLDGGYGDDVYNVRGDNDVRADTIVQDPGGIDTVIAHMTNWTLAAGLENLYFVDYRGSGFHGTGNELDNIISGGGAEGSYLFGLGGNDLLVAGSWGSAQLEGGDGNDTLWGAGHGDYLSGGAGDDLLDGGAFGFEDGLEGGTGADTFVFVGDDGGPATVIGDFASGADTIRLDGFDLSGYGFVDIGPSGRLAAGDARFWASSSSTAHDASDRVIYNTATGELWYDADGNGAGAARIIVQLHGAPTLVATDLEVVNGSPSPRGVYGTWGDDSLVGGEGNDTITALGGNDTLRGLGGSDSLVGGGGDDHYYVSTGDVLVEEVNDGVDTVHSDVSWTLGANLENLVLDPGGVTANGNNLNNILTGNAGNNSSINGRAGNDTMLGMGGNDVFDMSTGGAASYGNDVIDGGSGTDSVEFGGNARTAVNINLAAGTVSGGGDGGAGSATLTSIENALGGNFNDTLTGNAGANYFRGSNGNDTLNGGSGNDRLQGDAGNDSFVFNQLGTANSDTVIGFAGGADKLLMENAVMAAIGANGNFAAGDARFWSSTAGTAHDANDRVIYDTDSGQLWYDADGNGGGAAQLIATLQGNPGLAATDIAVI